MSWLLKLLQGLFGSFLDFAADEYKEAKLEKDAADARAARARLQSALDGEQMEDELVDAANAIAAVTDDTLDEAIEQYNQS